MWSPKIYKYIDVRVCGEKEGLERNTRTLGSTCSRAPATNLPPTTSGFPECLLVLTGISRPPRGRWDSCFGRTDRCRQSVRQRCNFLLLGIALAVGSNGVEQ